VGVRRAISVLVIAASSFAFMSCDQEEPPFSPHQVEVSVTNFYAWEGMTSLLSFTRPTHLHFAFAIPNRNPGAMSIHNIQYEVRSHSGTVLEVGRISSPQPATLGIREVGVAGRTISLDAAISPMEIGEVWVTYEVRPTKKTPVWLRGEVSDVRMNMLSQRVVIRGELQNRSEASSARVEGLAVALIAADGNVYAYGTGNASVRDIPGGSRVRFEAEVHGDLPMDGQRVAFPGDWVVLSWASGISDGFLSPLSLR